MMATVPGSEAQKLIDELSHREPLRSAVLGVLAVTRSGDTLAVCNHRVKMLPASTTKTVTTALALRKLGGDYRFETSLAYYGELRDSTLFGDLYIVGGADPTTGSLSDCAEPLSSLFGRWRRMILKAGIRRIEGRILGDPRCCGDFTPSYNWEWEDLGYNYGALPAGLNFFENQQNFFVSPGPATGTAPFIKARYPDAPWLRLINRAVTSGPKTRNTLNYENSPFAPCGRFTGSFPIDRKGGYTFEGANRFGAYTCAYYFHNYLCRNGIAVKGGFGDISPEGNVRTDLSAPEGGFSAPGQEKLVLIGTTCSPALRDIVKDTNHNSDNFFAETLCRAVGGVEEENRMLDAMGLDTRTTCHLADGSGLSRENYISPDFFVRFLRMVEGPDFRRSLPSPGLVDSTLEYRMKDATDDMKSRIHMKSGSMNGVRCFCGYIDSASGNRSRDVIFAVMSNNVTVSAQVSAKIIDEIIAALAG